jgi:hypothetical protein
MQKYKTYFTGKMALHVAQIVNTEQLQHIYPRNVVCFRYIIVNTLHKGDNKDDDEGGGGGGDDNSFVYLYDMHQQMIKTSLKGENFCLKYFFSMSLLQQDSACVYLH